MKKTDNKKDKGFTIVEILVALFVIAVALSALLGLAVFSLKITSIVKETQQANAFAKELMEITRNFRDGTSWDTNGLGALTIGQDYYPVKSGSPAVWEFSTGTEIRGIFNGKVVFDSVRRDDTSDDIIESGGTIDPKTIKATVTVSWNDREIQLVSYFTNW